MEDMDLVVMPKQRLADVNPQSPNIASGKVEVFNLVGSPPGGFIPPSPPHLSKHRMSAQKRDATKSDDERCEKAENTEDSVSSLSEADFRLTRRFGITTRSMSSTGLRRAGLSSRSCQQFCSTGPTEVIA